MAWLEMQDRWTFRPKEVLENKKHLFECRDSKSDTGHSLLVDLAASHSGIVNGNRRFYRPDKMQEGVHSWLPQQTKDGVVLRTPRPVLIGHNEKCDPLGRVLQAKYVDDSWRYAGEFPVVKDFLFYQRDGRKRQSLFDSVDWIVDNLMDLREYTGLGYTDLGVRITNPEGIRKVLADEYLTVSVGFRTDAAICSICHTDWATDGKCEHSLGEKVDGKRQFLITGAFDYQEVSFINFAADPFATTIGKKTLTDSLEKIFFLGLSIQTQQGYEAAGMGMTDGLFDSDIVPTEGIMDTKVTLDPGKIRDEIKSPELTQDRALELKGQLGAWEPETDALKTEKRSLVSTVNAKIRKNGWDKPVVENTDSEVASELAELLAPPTPAAEPPATDGAPTPAEPVVEPPAAEINPEAKPVETDAAATPDIMSDEQKFTERAEKFIAGVPVQDGMKPVEVTAEERTELVGIVVALDKAYDRLAAKDAPRYSLRWAVRAILADWDSDEDVRWALRSLQGTDSVVISAAELAEKDEALNGAMADKEVLAAEITALKDSRLAVLNASKRALAQQVVMHGVLTGQDAYKDLTAEQREEKIDELSKRNIVSLKDSVSDILTGLHWTKITDSTPKTTEPLVSMNDNARVPEEAPVGTSASDTDRQQAETIALHDKLDFMFRHMTIPERNKFLARQRAKAAQTT